MYVTSVETAPVSQLQGEGARRATWTAEEAGKGGRGCRERQLERAAGGALAAHRLPRLATAASSLGAPACPRATSSTPCCTSDFSLPANLAIATPPPHKFAPLDLLPHVALAPFALPPPPPPILSVGRKYHVCICQDKQ